MTISKQRLSAWAREQGISYKTAYRWFKQGQLPTAEQTASGTILVSPPKSDAPAKRNSPPLTPWAKIAHYKAELLKLEYERQQDLWIRRDQVEREAFTLGREIRDRLLMLPDRIADELLACASPEDLVERLRQEIEKVLELLTAPNTTSRF